MTLRMQIKDSVPTSFGEARDSRDTRK